MTNLRTELHLVENVGLGIKSLDFTAMSGERLQDGDVREAQHLIFLLNNLSGENKFHFSIE